MNYLCIYYKPELSPCICREESPDSIGQPTGEEPGVSFETTDSATENNCLSPAPPVETVGGEGENVR